MKGLGKGLAVIGVLALLTGCGGVQQAEQDISSYNKLVDATLSGYALSRAYAESQNSLLKEYVLHGSEFETPTRLENLTPTEQEAFKLNTVVLDDYFTSLGSEGVREVLVLKGTGGRMFVTAVWGSDSLLDLERKVFLNE